MASPELWGQENHVKDFRQEGTCKAREEGGNPKIGEVVQEKLG